MTNWQFVLAGNLGEAVAWQLVLFPLTMFLLAKCTTALTKRRGVYRSLIWLHVLSAEIISYVVLLLVAVVLTVIFEKQKVMFDPEICSSSDDCRRGSLKFSEEETINVSEGSRVILYRMKGNSSGRLRYLNASVLYTHGNSGSVASHLPSVSYVNLLDMGVDVLTWDPPGFGRSPGEASFVAWMTAAHAVVGHARESEKNLILYGRSLGGAVSAILASEQRFMGVILEVPLDSMQFLFHDFFRLTAYVMGPWWKDNFDAYSAIDSITTCLFHYAAEHDELITDYRQKRLHERAHSRQRNCSDFLVGEGKWHNDVSWDVDYQTKISDFMTKAVEMNIT